MQALFFKIDFFFIPRKGMHTYSFLILRNDVCPAVLLYALQLIYRLKKKTTFKTNFRWL